jgi:hypothetical protein
VYTRNILYRILCHQEIRIHNVHPREKIKVSQKHLKTLTRLARHNTVEFSVDAKTYVKSAVHAAFVNQRTNKKDLKKEETLYAHQALEFDQTLPQN